MPSTDPPAETVTAAAERIVDNRLHSLRWSNADTQAHRAALMPQALADATVALNTAAPALRDQGATTERRRIIQLAERVNATCPHYPAGSHVSKQTRPFADLLRDQPQPTTTQEPT